MPNSLLRFDSELVQNNVLDALSGDNSEPEIPITFLPFDSTFPEMQEKDFSTISIPNEIYSARPGLSFLRQRSRRISEAGQQLPW